MICTTDGTFCTIVYALMVRLKDAIVYFNRFEKLERRVTCLVAPVTLEGTINESKEAVIPAN